MAKTKIGQIISDKMNLTATVKIDRMVEHPLYRKKHRVSNNIKAHNPENQYKTGDKVIIEETKPISKDKSWVIKGKVD